MSLRILNPDLLKKLPEAVCLDLDNTLYDYESANQAGQEAVFKKMGQSLGLSRNDLEVAFSTSRQQIKARLKNQASSHSRLLYFQRMLEVLGLKTQPLMVLDLEQTFWRHYLHNCQLYDGVKDFLFLLRSKNIVTALITDLTVQIQFRKVIYLKIDRLIDFIVTSEEAGADKPDQAPFNLVLDKLGLPAERVWMIGDSYEKDISGLQTLGLCGILKGKEKYNQIPSPTWAEFDNFTDLMKLFQQIDGASRQESKA